MWIPVLVLLLLGAQLNVTALVPAAPAQAPPPWWVGGGLLWPFFSDTKTLLPAGQALNTFTPLLGIAAGLSFLLAAAALLGWGVPAAWFRWLVVAGVAFSVPLQVIWLSGWAVLPLLVDAVLLWLMFGAGVSVGSLRG